MLKLQTEKVVVWGFLDLFGFLFVGFVLVFGFVFETQYVTCSELTM